MSITRTKRWTALQILWLVLFILLAPWSLLVLPFLGFWYILFVSQYLIYDALNEELQIEAQFIPIEGNPWPEDDPDDDEEE